MENVITAKEAREIAISKKKNISDIMDSLRVLANTGRFSAGFELSDILESGEIKLALESLGYTVGINNDTDTFRVNW